MSAIPKTQAYSVGASTVFLFGTQPWIRDWALKQSVEAGLRAVVAKMASDQSEASAGKIRPSTKQGSATPLLSYHAEVLPDEVNAISVDLVTRLQQEYG